MIIRDFIPAGSVYDIAHRRGSLTIRFLQAADFTRPETFDGEIVGGRAVFISAEAIALQRSEGFGTLGDTMRFLTTLTQLVRHRPELEKGAVA